MGDSDFLTSGDDSDRLILNVWHEWEIADGERRITLCVETGAELRPGLEGFDPARLDRLMQAAIELKRKSASPIDAVRIVPARWTL